MRPDFVAEAGLTIRSPRRLLKLLDPAARQRLRRANEARNFLHAFDAPWRASDDGKFRQRRYSCYDVYVDHQRSKLDGTSTWVTEVHDPRLRDALAGRLDSRSFVRPGMSVLCLGARTGGEVQAFRDVGCFAVGIDLNPGGASSYVLDGDFHSLLFPDACVDLAYCNCVDHVFDFDRFCSETRRIVKPYGVLLLELPKREDHRAGLWESFVWNDVADLIEKYERVGFTLVEREELCGFPYEDGGDSLVLRRTSRSLQTSAD